MKKQYIILLAIVSALMAALFLSACSQPAASSSGAAATSSAAAESSAEASASADAEASASADVEAPAPAVDESVEFTGLPALQPADHEGRTSDMCPTCHLDGSNGAAAIPEDHFDESGNLVAERLQCVTCHSIEPAA